MFSQLYEMLIKTDSKEPEIQILTGWFEKPTNLKERIKKIKRVIKYTK